MTYRGLGPRWATINLAAVTAAVALLWVLIDPAERPSDAGLFLGRFHPALVHFPIGLLVLGVLLDVVRRTRDLAGVVLVAGSWMAVISAAAGLWLVQAGGYDADTLFLHRLAGVVLAVGAAALPVLRLRGAPDRVSLSWAGVLAATLMVGGHEGGTLTHGPGYLTAHAPAFVQAALGVGDTPPRLQFGDPDSTTVFESVVQPILYDRCVACHGEGRTRAGLDLRTADSVTKGSEDGPVLAPGRVEESPLIARIQLPDGHRKKMPPDDATPLSPADARLLSWWVAQGASFDATLSEADMPPDVRAILDANGLGDIRTGVWALDVPAAPAAAVAALEALGARVRPVAQDEPFLSVRCNAASNCFADGGAALAALADQIVWLDLARTDVTDADLALLAPLVHLEKVWLQKTSIDGSGLRALQGAPFLVYLNVSETGVTPEALVPVRHVGDLYVWGSPAAS